MFVEKVPLQNLGVDIIINGVFKFLDFKDIISVSQTCRQINQLTLNDSVWHDLYIRSFGIEESIPEGCDWKDLFYWRKQAKWLSWGKTTRYRISYLGHELDPSFISNGNPGFPRTLGLCRPFKNGPLLEEEDLPQGAIRKLYLGGSLEGILLLNNKLFSQGIPMRSEFPRALPAIGRDANGNQVVHRIRVAAWGFYTPEPGARGDNEDSESEENDRYNQDGCQMSQASFGRYHILAVDNENNLVVGQLRLGKRHVKYIKVVLPEELQNHTILKVCAGWGNTNAILIDQIGLILYEQGENHASKVENYHIVSKWKSNEPILDFFLGEDFLIYLDSGRNVTSVDLKALPDRVSKCRLSDIEEKFKELYLSKTKRIISDLPLITRTNGWFRRFAVYDDYGHVLIVKRNDNQSDTNGLGNKHYELEVYDSLQNSNCSAIAFGDHHNMALVDGQIYVWGSESQQCGCFGLGREEEVLNLPTSSRTRGGLQLQQPTLVPIEGYVVAIAAGGWQSSALVVDTPPPRAAAPPEAQ